MLRRRLLGAVAGLATTSTGLAGCITDPGRSCPGATVRLTLRPVESVEDPLVLDPEELSTAADAVVEAAIEDAHVERCVEWDGDPGPSAGLREVGERIEAHLDVDLAGRREPVATDASRRDEGYRLRLELEERR